MKLSFLLLTITLVASPAAFADNPPKHRISEEKAKTIALNHVGGKFLGT